MEKLSYSQIGQDLWVLEKFPIHNGFFIDVGFSDGVLLSNTYLLELNGWSGLGIDPIPINYEQRKNTKIFKEAVYSQPDIELDFVKSGMFSGFLNEINAGPHKKIITKEGTEFVKLKTKTLADILSLADCPNFIHYMSLDTEGSEYEILKTFPFDKYSFGCITVEHNYVKSQRHKIKTLLESVGYKLEKQQRWDDWYVQNKFY